MPASQLDPARRQFQERILNQLRARYPEWEFAPVPDGFAVGAKLGRAQVVISLATLHETTRRPEASAPEEIARFVSSTGPRLAAAEASPEAQAAPDPEALVWCVRPLRMIQRFTRADELVLRPLPAGLVAFVSESLPGEVMRGVSADEAKAVGMDRAELEARSDRNTALHLRQWRQVLAERPSQNRWLFTEDTLFSSSLLLVPEFLREVAERGGGSAGILVPDRGMVVAAVREAAQPEQLQHIARRLYGIARSPLIPQMLITDGVGLALHPAEERTRRPWSGWRQVLGLRSR